MLQIGIGLELSVESFAEHMPAVKCEDGRVVVLGLEHRGGATFELDFRGEQELPLAIDGTLDEPHHQLPELSLIVMLIGSLHADECLAPVLAQLLAGPARGGLDQAENRVLLARIPLDLGVSATNMFGSV